MSSRAGALAVLVRKVQWLLDEAAHDLPAGRVSDAEQERLADVLDHLATALRGQDAAPVVIDAEAHH